MPPPMDTLSTEEQRQVVELVQDFFRYQLQKRGIRWSPPGTGRHAGTSADHLELCLALRSLGDEFLAKYRENVVSMVTRLELSDVQVEPAFTAVLDEMFAEGISWSRLVVAFVFAVEFAYQLVEKQSADNCIEHTSQWLMNYTALRLVPWVRTHSGWAGLIQFKEEHANGHAGDDEASIWPFFKNAFCGVAGVALGALALGAFLTSKS